MKKNNEKPDTLIEGLYVTGFVAFGYFVIKLIFIL